LCPPADELSTFSHRSCPGLYITSEFLASPFWLVKSPILTHLLDADGTGSYDASMQATPTVPPAERRRQVLLATVWWEPAQTHGIARFARGADWRLDLVGPENASDLARWHGDGIICQLHRSAGPLVRRIRRLTRVPKVGMSLFLPRAADAHVVPDYARTGRLAAEHFLDRGFRYFAFCGWARRSWYRRLRRRGFVDRLAQAGHAAETITCPDPGSPAAQRRNFDRRRHLAHQVAQLPVPLAIAVDDARLATALVDGCCDTDLLVPEQVAIVSLMDDMLICECGQVPLSAISGDYEEQGYQAAVLLDRLMAGGLPPTEPILVPPMPLVVRHSSDVTAIDSPSAARAVKFIMDHLASGQLYVPAVVAASGVSKSTLTREFLQHVGRSIAAEIRRLRLENAMRLIRETTMPFTQVAKECGYSGLKHLERSVRREAGVCPRQLRRRESATDH